CLFLVKTLSDREQLKTYLLLIIMTINCSCSVGYFLPYLCFVHSRGKRQRLVWLCNSGPGGVAVSPYQFATPTEIFLTALRLSVIWVVVVAAVCLESRQMAPRVFFHCY